jgi:signal transduction histidine kinase
MTHELKTPLATIRAVGESVASGRVTTAEMVREYAQLVVQESKRLTRIVDNSLAYSRITDVADAYHLEALDLPALVEEALHGFTSQSSAKDFEIEIDVPADLPQIHGDRTAMGLLLDNLIDNAARYSGESRWIGVRAWRTSRAVHVAIADHGVGIPRNEIRLVVRKFVRGRRAGSGGSGLGLAIVSRIVEAHGGTLDLQSTVGVGTTVAIALPISDVTDDEANSHR